VVVPLLERDPLGDQVLHQRDLLLEQHITPIVAPS
jgi:hypothetical protein